MFKQRKMRSFCEKKNNDPTIGSLKVACSGPDKNRFNYNRVLAGSLLGP